MLLAKRLGGIFFMSKFPNTQSRTQPQKEKNFFVSVFFGTLISLVIGLALLVISCFLGLFTEDPSRLTPIFALAVLFITALLSGYISARTYRENGFFCGLLSGILLVGTLVILIFAFRFTIRFSLFSICAPAVVIASSLAGIGGVNTKAPRTRHKKKF
jgi:putative membrane protein (TIGR04086 family)